MRAGPLIDRTASYLPLLLACALVACAESIEPPDDPPVPIVEAPVEREGPAHLAVSEQVPYGPYLTDADGRALYLFTADTQGQRSTCYAACADAWPPLTTIGPPVAVDARVDTIHAGVIRRGDGVEQVSYDGWPLYYYHGDAGAGSVAGQDVHGFGGEWYLVSPEDGGRIEAEGTSEEGSGS